MMTVADKESMFVRIVLGTKFVAILCLVVLSLINRNVQYIERNPLYFIQDALMLGLSSALGTLLIGKVRTGHYEFEGAFMTFLLFFMYSVLRELSGYFNLIKKGSKLTKTEDKIKKQYSILVTGVLGVILIACGVLVFTIKRYPDRYTYHYLTNNSMLMFAIETVVFALITGVPEDIIDQRHETEHHHHHGSIVQSVLMSAVLHIAFQFGGLYHMFFKQT